jgi:hypothetical protein
MTPEERRRERYARYNRSVKGQARDRAYEARHPERKLRWPVRQGARLPVTSKDSS